MVTSSSLAPKQMINKGMYTETNKFSTVYDEFIDVSHAYLELGVCVAMIIAPQRTETDRLEPISPSTSAHLLRLGLDRLSMIGTSDVCVSIRNNLAFHSTRGKERKAEDLSDHIIYPHN